MNERRFGRFDITTEILENDPDMAHAILDRVLVIKANFNFATECIEYLAVGPDFDRVELGYKAPYYQPYCISSYKAIDESVTHYAYFIKGEKD